MKIQRIKDIVTGAIVASLVLGTIPTAFAKVAKMDIPVNFNNIKVVVDGKELQTDKEPFIYDGTTYLPVRAVAEAVGKEVGWNGETQTVTLTTKANDNTQTTTQQQEQEKETPTVTQSGEILYNENGIKITYTGLSEGALGTKIDLLIENSTSTNYCVQVRDLSVNGFMVDSIFSCDVSPGKKANDGITILSSSMQSNGITEIYEFEGSFHIFDNDDWSKYFDTEMVSVKVK